MLYLAYGSNLHRAGMLSRCPGAVPLGRAVLDDHALAFRTWADIVPRLGARVAGGLWRITPACRAALDLYKEVRDGLYEAVVLPVRPDGGGNAVKALAYRMLAAPPAPPTPDYLAAVLQGCRDFGLDDGPVRAAAAAI